MNPWRGLIGALDEIPESDRRLLSYLCWDDDAKCGNVFGVIMVRRGVTPPRYFPHVSALITREARRVDDTYRRSFADWADSIGLTWEIAREVQSFNNNVPIHAPRGLDERTARWFAVYEFIQRRAKAFDERAGRDERGAGTDDEGGSGDAGTDDEGGPGDAGAA